MPVSVKHVHCLHLYFPSLSCFLPSTSLSFPCPSPSCPLSFCCGYEPGGALLSFSSGSGRSPADRNVFDALYATLSRLAKLQLPVMQPGGILLTDPHKRVNSDPLRIQFLRTVLKPEFRNIPLSGHKVSRRKLVVALLRSPFRDAHLLVQVCVCLAFLSHFVTIYIARLVRRSA